jgi:hypothetical protein
MARKTDKSESAHGLSYVIGVTLLAAALVLCVAQWAFARGDRAVNQTPPNSPTHNHAGWLGAQVAHGFFFLLGAGAYLLPVALVVLGLGCWFEWLAYLRRRWPWLLILLLSVRGGCIWQTPAARARVRGNIGAPYLGGFAGYLSYEYGFWMVGTAGAVILYGALYFISLLYLTNFQLGGWLRWLWQRRPGFSGAGRSEIEALERRARQLEKQKRALEEEVARGAGLGADLQPVPEPTVRDLSVPQPKSGRAKKSAAETPREIAPADEGEVVVPRDEAAASAGRGRQGNWQSPAGSRETNRRKESTQGGSREVAAPAIHGLQPPGPSRASPNPSRCVHADDWQLSVAPAGVPANRRISRPNRPSPRRRCWPTPT